METMKSMSNPQQQIGDWQRKLRQERQARDMQREEKSLQKDIKEAVNRKDVVSAKGTFYRTRGDTRRFEEFCAKEAVANRCSLERVLWLFSRCLNEWIYIPGASAHRDYLMETIYDGATYHARLHQNPKDLSVFLTFGQMLFTIMQFDTLEEACKKAGMILNESIQSSIEMDYLYALPNAELNVYPMECWSGYKIYEAAVRVDFRSAIELHVEDLNEVNFVLAV